MLEEAVSSFMEELTECGKIYLLSKLATIATASVDNEKSNNFEELMFSTASNILICSIAEQKMTTNDKIMVDSFITSYAEIPEGIMSAVNHSIESVKGESMPKEFDVMYV